MFYSYISCRGSALCSSQYSHGYDTTYNNVGDTGVTDQPGRQSYRYVPYAVCTLVSVKARRETAGRLKLAFFVYYQVLDNIYQVRTHVILLPIRSATAYSQRLHRPSLHFNVGERQLSCMAGRLVGRHCALLCPEQGAVVRPKQLRLGVQANCTAPCSISWKALCKRGKGNISLGFIAHMSHIEMPSALPVPGDLPPKGPDEVDNLDMRCRHGVLPSLKRVKTKSISAFF